MGIGPHRVGAGSANHELQELVDQWVADSVLDLTVGTDVTLERRTPFHRTPPARVCTRESLRCLSQEVDHLYNRRWGAVSPPVSLAYPGPCGWMVSPRASISTNCLIRLALVSFFFAVLMR